MQRVELGRDDTSRADSMMIRNVEEEPACEAHQRNHFDGHDVYDPRITSPQDCFDKWSMGFDPVDWRPPLI